MGSRGDRDPAFESALLPRLQNTIEKIGDQAGVARKATTTAPTALMFPVPKATTMALAAVVDERGATSRLMFHQRAITTARAVLMSEASNPFRRRKIGRSVTGRPKRVSLNAET